LHKLFDENAVPSLPVYIDSPLAENITEVFSKYTKYFNDDFWKDFGNKNDNPFVLKNLIYVKTVEESKSINNKQGPFMVISASGMAESGRVLHHLKNNISDANNVILITGYQAENTLGRKLQEGAKNVKIYGENYDVRAKVITLNEFSAHADQNGLLNYIKALNQLKRIFLVHTEMPQATIFKEILEKSLPSIPVEIPSMGQSIEL
jgi:metallo-beta-lactamase family protein